MAGRRHLHPEDRIARDLGTFDAPDGFYRQHRQEFDRIRAWLYRRVIRHWMNTRVDAIRSGRFALSAAKTEHEHEESGHAA